MAGKRLDFGSLVRNKITWAVVAVAVALAVTWPAASLASTSPPFDLQAAINACPAGGSVAIPAGTYTFTSQVALKDGVSLRGAGIDKTVLYMPAQVEYTNLLRGDNVSNLSISDLTLASSAAADKVFAMRISNYSNVTIERVKVKNAMHVLKADTQGTNLTVTDLTAEACGQLYVSNLTNGVFTNLNLQMTQTGLDAYWHAIYVCANNHHLRFTNVVATGSKGWTVQLWSDYGWSQPSDDIVFDGLYTDGKPLAISSGFSNVTFRNLTAVSTVAGYDCILVCDPYNLTIDGFNGSGSSNFLNRYTGYTTRDVSLKNGSYAGKVLVSEEGNWISNLTVQNVNLGTSGSTTPTTAAPVTTTTTAAPVVPPVAPSTTTTLAPTTTTTLAPTPTTLAPTTTTTAAPASTTASGTVTITSLSDGATVSRGTVSLRVSVSSSTRVGTVYFYVDGKVVGRDGRAPYAYSWRTTSLAPGSRHLVEAVAYSSSGVELGKASVSVTVAQATTTTTGVTYSYPYWWK